MTRTQDMRRAGDLAGAMDHLAAVEQEISRLLEALQGFADRTPSLPCSGPLGS
jgi:hypothetical protein